MEGTWDQEDPVTKPDPDLTEVEEERVSVEGKVVDVWRSSFLYNRDVKAEVRVVSVVGQR